MEKIKHENEINREGSIFNRKHQCLASTDEVMLMARNKMELKSITEILITNTKTFGLSVNDEESKFMELEYEYADHENLEETVGEVHLAADTGGKRKIERRSQIN
ncbi:hypothetical protein HHI36_009952, partial [Cryptolaemus montrouzieri]